MSTHANVDIVNNGLVLYIDENNRQKSWKGQPTTNYVTNALSMTGWSNYGNGTPVPITTSLGTPGYGFYNAGSWNGLSRSVTVPSAGTYTFSAWIRYIGGSSNNNGGGVYISGYGAADANVTTNRTLPGQWQRLSITLNCTNTTFTFYLISWGGTNGADNSSWEMTMPQAESGSNASTFVDGTRTNTQTLVDLTNNNTITAVGLTYASDGTFSFNGSTGYLDCGNNSILQQTSAITMFAWVKPTSTTGLGNIMSKNANSGYRFRIDNGQLWWYVSGNAAVGGSCPNGIWSHCAVTGDSSGLKAYVNGTLVASNSSAFSPSAPAGGNLYIGTYGAAEFFNGSIGASGMYNRALSADEIAQNFNAVRNRYNV